MAIQTVTSENLVEMSQPKQETPVVATGEETVSTAPDPGEQTPVKHEKKGVQERIDELTRLRKEAEEFAEDEYNARLRAERRATDLEQQLQNIKPKAAEPEPELVKPDPRTYTDQAKYDADEKAYLEAVIARGVQKRLVEERQKEAIERQNEQMRQRVEKAKEDIPDFEQVIQDASRRNPIIPPHIQGAIVESELGPQLAYWLAKNPAEQKRIFALTPAKALLELGKVEIGLATPEKPAAKPTVETTRAPAPIASISGGEGKVNSDLSNADFATYRKARLQEMRAKRGR